MEENRIIHPELNRKHQQDNYILLIYGAIYLLIGLYFALSGGGYYDAASSQKLHDLLEAKIWLFLSILMGVFIYRAGLSRQYRLWGWVLNLSVYFVILYSLLYKGTDFGLNGPWGDNANRLALIEKFRDFPSSIFQDWYHKNLPSFYPPLWFFISGKLAWLFGIEAYRTIKLGYFVIYALYPPVLFYCWSRITSRSVAFVITFLIVFLHDVYLDYVYYEHITCSLFILWWLYYVENINKKTKRGIIWFLTAGILGALLFMTYYTWFFLGIMTIILRQIMILFPGEKPYLKTTGIGYKSIIGLLVLIFSSVYWLPLLLSFFKYGYHPIQTKWFQSAYLNMAVPIFNVSAVSFAFLIGLIYIFAHYRRRIHSSYILILLTIPILMLIDRFLCLFEISIQTRKLTELLPVFLSIPAGFGMVFIYRLIIRKIRYGRAIFVSIFMLLVLYFGNLQSQVLKSQMYVVGINSRVSEKDIGFFKSVDYRGRVFLTSHYMEAIYLPYYLFLSPTGAASHSASRFEQRIDFVKYLERLSDPAQVACLLKRNCFDTVDYLYLPMDKDKKCTLF